MSLLLGLNFVVTRPSITLKAGLPFHAPTLTKLRWSNKRSSVSSSKLVHLFVDTITVCLSVIAYPYDTLRLGHDIYGHSPRLQIGTLCDTVNSYLDAIRYTLWYGVIILLRIANTWYYDIDLLCLWNNRKG